MTQIHPAFEATSSFVYVARPASRDQGTPRPPLQPHALPDDVRTEASPLPEQVQQEAHGDLNSAFFPRMDTERQTVLIVDDEPCIAGLLAELLDSAGYRALTAGNGQVALTIVRVVHPELVISDCMMPELDGVGLAKAMRAQPATRDIPVVLMSSTRPEMSTLGEIPFLEKPFDLDHVLDLVELYAAATQWS